MRKLCLLATVAAAVLAHNSNAATITSSQFFGDGGDFATGVFIDNFMPTFDPALGTLQSVRIGISADLDWSEPILVEAPPPSTFGLDEGAFLYDLADDDSADIRAAPRTWTVTTTTFGFSDAVHFHGFFDDDPSAYLDAANPPDLIVNPFGAVNEGDCTGFCQVDFSDDAFGFIEGTLTTRLTYTPADRVPEPASFGLLAMGLLGLAGVRRILS